MYDELSETEEREIIEWEKPFNPWMRVAIDSALFLSRLLHSDFRNVSRVLAAFDVSRYVLAADRFSHLAEVVADRQLRIVMKDQYDVLHSFIHDYDSCPFDDECELAYLNEEAEEEGSARASD